MAYSMYNEAAYLNGDQDVIAKFHQEYIEDQERIAEEKVKFANVLKNYDELITRTAKFIRSLGYDSSMDCSLLLSHMIRNGLLSNDQAFTAEEQKYTKEILASLGTTIVVGNGCCRNHAQMHTDVFNALGLFTKDFYCFMGGSARTGAFDSECNHVINLINYNNQLYGIDLYNSNRLFRFRNPFIMVEITNSGKEYLRYKPYKEIENGTSDIYKIVEQLDMYRRSSKGRSITASEYEGIIKVAARARYNKLNADCVFDDFQEEIQPLKKEIYDEITSHFGRL